MPTLYILGGANGVGKTTWYNTALKNGDIDPSLSFINVDNIILNQFQGNYSYENDIKAKGIAKERIAELIKNKESFIMEANLAKTADYDLLNSYRNAGYEIELYFLSTNNVEINKGRVLQRVQEGGHDVAPSIIEHRHKIALTYLKSKILEFNKATLYDTSQRYPRKMVELKLGKILYKNQSLQQWAKETIFIAERLQEKLIQKKNLGLDQNENLNEGQKKSHGRRL